MNIVIIGGGFGGLAAAGLLAKSGHKVTLLEKNEQLGGRAGVFEAEGYRFDMGPSWYLMPEIFEQFFRLMGTSASEQLELIRLQPSYRVFFASRPGRPTDIFSDVQRDRQTFEQFESGAGDRLESYLKRAEYLYEIAKNGFIYRNYGRMSDFLTPQLLTEGRKLHVFQKMDGYVSRSFTSPELKQIMQYALVFLGGSPYNTPALYNIMSHIDFNQGVFYPQGGFGSVVKSLTKLAQTAGADLRLNSPVEQILTHNRQVTGVRLADGEELTADIVISNADIHHTETELLQPLDRSYSARYWNSRTLAPSALLMYLGIDGRVPELTHHNLYFSKDWKHNFGQIFDHPAWPDDPSLYVCAPSVTDPSVAPKGKENLFVLVPIAPRLEYDAAFLDSYADKILELIAREMKIPDLMQRVEYRQLFCVKDFESRYHSYGGSALGLAHTLRQTAVFRPDTASKKVKNLYYVGAGTNPGIGVPITLISAELVYKRITNDRSVGPLGAIDAK